jgi:phosphoserine aminotransferase
MQKNKETQMTNRVYNFNDSPSALPLPSTGTAKEELLISSGTGMSITEISHRSTAFDEVIDTAIARVKRLLNLDDNYWCSLSRAVPVCSSAWCQ